MQSPTVAVPYWRLSAFYFFYFSVLGAMIPYWGLYLESLGCTPQQIGWFAAILMATKIIAPNLWGYLADLQGRRLHIIRLGAFLACLCFCGMLIDQRFVVMAVVVACYSFFWNAILSQFEVITLGHLEDEPERYSQVRLWGSIGFIVAVVWLGWFFDRMSIDWLPWFVLGLLAAIWVSSLLIWEQPTGKRRHEGAGVMAILRQRPVWAFLLICFLLQIAHGPYYTFYSVFLNDHGYSRTLIGQLWSLGVVAEVVIFLVMHKVLPKVGLRFVCLLSLILSAGRWLIIGYGVDSLALLCFAQLLHAFSFGAFHSCAIELVRRYFSPGHEGQGQALYGAVSFGAGGAVGSSISGYLWGYSPALTFVMASVACVLAWLVGLLWLRGEQLRW